MGAMARSQWLGRRFGSSPALTFNNTEGYRWKTHVPGHSSSSPVVWDNFVLLPTEVDTADPPTLALLCFDRTDGRLLWQTDAASAHGRTHAKNGHASASVATDGERIFCVFRRSGTVLL